MKKEKMKELLNFLLHSTDYVTSEQLAKRFDISKVTVIRWIATINQRYDQPIIISERGVGYKINYGVYLRNTSPIDEEEDRCLAVIRELLLSAPKAKRLDQIYDKFFVSESVIKKDQQLIGKKLARYGLALKRHARSLAIAGSEKNVRAAIMEIILNLDKATDIGAIESQAKDIDHLDLKFAIKQLEFASAALGGTLQYPYNVSFLSHIYVLLSRAKKYKTVTLTAKSKELKQEKILDQLEIYSVCKQIFLNIEQYLGMKISSSEIYYLFDYLSSARLSETSDVIVHELAEQIAKDYISLVSQKLKVLFEVTNLAELSSHIQYMLERLEKNILLTNALLEEIYEAILDASQKIVDKYNLPEISQDESGFIALYFAKYLELGIKKVNAYVICTTGLGTSKLLAVKIKQTLPTINIIGMSANTNISQTLANSPKKIDLLISTIPLEEVIDIPVVLVSAILTSRDIVSLNNAVGEVVNEK